MMGRQMQIKQFIPHLIAALLTVPTLAFGASITFKGAPCTKDCSGHQAGYEWARKKGIKTPGQCGGKSNSFTEGCRIWAKEHHPPSDAHSLDK
jgi:hypothetical protein